MQNLILAQDSYTSGRYCSVNGILNSSCCLIKINAAKNHSGRMQTSQPVSYRLINYPVIKQQKKRTAFSRSLRFRGSASGNRTLDSAVRGRRLDLLTNAPYFSCAKGIITECRIFVYCFFIFPEINRPINWT